VVHIPLFPMLLTSFQESTWRVLHCSGCDGRTNVVFFPSSEAPAERSSSHRSPPPTTTSNGVVGVTVRCPEGTSRRCSAGNLPYPRHFIFDSTTDDFLLLPLRHCYFICLTTPDYIVTSQVKRLDSYSYFIARQTYIL